MSKFMEMLLQFPERRAGQGVQYRIGSMIAIVLMGFLAGRDSLKGCHRYAETLGKWQVRRLGIRSGEIPSYVALCNAFHEIDVDKLAEFFGAVVSAESKASKGLHLAIDGKSLNGSKVTKGKDEDGNRAVHILHAFSRELGAIVGQIEVDKKTNEAKAIIDLLENLEIKGNIITGDAMFCQKEIVKKNHRKGS
jgi:DDE_Tnp_1-associated/Transposase DDE domain